MKLLDKIKNAAGKKIIKRRQDKMVCEMLKHPDPRLSTENLLVDMSPKTRQSRVDLLQKLNATLNAQTWGGKLGIAAPQIGINLRACIVLGTPMFNPIFTAPKHGAETEMIEGCYSLPKSDVYLVKRAKYGWVKWYDVDGNFHDERVTDMKAIVAQHEISHLDGKCCNELGTLIERKIPQKL